MSAHRIAVVTGTSRGIGAAVAARLMDDGLTVVGMSRSGSPSLRGPRFHDLRVDLTDPGACAAGIERSIALAGGLDVLVNNAGLHATGPCWDLAPETFEALVTTNLTAPFLLSQAALRHWTERGTAGVVLNLCSVESEIAWPDPPQAAYAATKGGMVGLTRALAYDFGGLGIRVNGLAPGAVDTAMSPRDDERLTAAIPLQGRLGTVDEIAAAASFLVSEQAAYITGEILYVDGGYRLP
ncbi:SDR family NAD(P)-dependent oxidoreductase [Actinomadura sp. B10D3]|uniref:SDR family NAD(P)-dependent oxidoreductase n=1 Tax=Actinomadura sp. B10D3 TaxID=3153557 RepID=UPI00325E6926